MTIVLRLGQPAPTNLHGVTRSTRCGDASNDSLNSSLDFMRFCDTICASRQSFIRVISSGNFGESSPLAARLNSLMKLSIMPIESKSARTSGSQLMVFLDEFIKQKERKAGVGFWMLMIVCPSDSPVHRGNTTIGENRNHAWSCGSAGGCMFCVTVPRYRD